MLKVFLESNSKPIWVVNIQVEKRHGAVLLIVRPYGTWEYSLMGLSIQISQQSILYPMD